MTRFNIPVNKMEVTGLDYNEGNYLIKTKEGSIEAKTVVVASGTMPEELNEYDEDAKNRIFYDVESLKSVKGKDILIVGGGDAAFDYAVSLSSNNNVTIIHRGNKSSCLPVLFERAKKIGSIRYLENCAVKEIVKDGEKLVLRYFSETEFEIHIDYVIGAIGRKPDVGFLSEKLLEAYKEEKEVKNFYFIGDVMRGSYRQVGIAVGDGLLAAMQVYHLSKQVRNLNENIDLCESV
jgi:thioredoxin reductase